jgi:1,2-diacylglycerol-3-alpha-glucose alpha-1,2-galactosyltransferase
MKNTPKNLTITGVIPHNQVRDYLHAADVFCLPAEQENHPMCVLEAAGAGLPIVLRGMPEYKDTFYGDALMCDDDSFDGEIIKLRNNKEFYKKWKEKSKNIADRFDSKTAATKVLSIYKELI